MNLYHLSNIYPFLYSPTNWLHAANKKNKIFYVFLQLLVLPYSNINYIFIIFTFTFIILKSIYIPIKVHKNLIVTYLFFLFFLAACVYHTTKTIHVATINYPTLKVQPFCFITKLIKNYVKYSYIYKISQLSFYIPITITRLVIISLIYILTIKVFLLTTNYEDITLLLLKLHKNYVNLDGCKIPFIIVLSSQFLNTTFINIKKIRIAYLIRSMNYKKHNFSKQRVWFYIFLLKSFLISFYIHTRFISKSLHSRDIFYKDLYTINVYKQ